MSFTFLRQLKLLCAHRLCSHVSKLPILILALATITHTFFCSYFSINPTFYFYFFVLLFYYFFFIFLFFFFIFSTVWLWVLILC